MLEPGYAVDDGAALHFRERSLVQAISSRKEANAYSVRLIGEEVEETVLSMNFLDA
jgi:dipeptidase E